MKSSRSKKRRKKSGIGPTLPVAAWTEPSIEVLRIACSRLGLIEGSQLSALAQDDYFGCDLLPTVRQLITAGLLSEMDFLAKSLRLRRPTCSSNQCSPWVHPDVDTDNDELPRLLELRHFYLPTRKACNLFGIQYAFGIDISHIQRAFNLGSVFNQYVRHFGYRQFCWLRPQCDDRFSRTPDAAIRFSEASRSRYIFMIPHRDEQRQMSICDECRFSNVDYEIWQT